MASAAQYLERISKYRGVSLPVRSGNKGQPEILWDSQHLDLRQYSAKMLLEAIEEVAGKRQKFAFCIIKDIDQYWIGALGRKLGLSTQFFAEHFSRSFDATRVRPWTWADDLDDRSPDQLFEEEKQERHIDGFCNVPGSGAARISYRRLYDNIYFMLVREVSAGKNGGEGTPETGTRRANSHPWLRLMYSVSKNGLVVPRSFDPNKPTTHTFDILKEALSHDWVRSRLFAPKSPVEGQHRAIRAHPFLYLLADAMWKHNIKYLDGRVKGITSSNSRNSKLDAHFQLREDLEMLKTTIQQTVRSAPPGLHRSFENDPWVQVSETSVQPDRTPIEYLQEIVVDAVALQQYLTESLNLRLAELAEKNSNRADMLTWLAAIYVPLSFVTSIFGMNLKELNGSTLPYWICLEVLGVVLLVTVGVMLCFIHRETLAKLVGLRRRTAEHMDEHRVE